MSAPATMSPAAIAPARDRASDVVEVRRIVRAAGSSFAAGMRVLPRARREAIHAVYAFCRVADDIADGDAPGARRPEDRAARLDELDHEIARAVRGAPRTAVGAEVARAVERFDLPAGEFALLVDGMRMDAQRIVAPPADVLAAYVRRVAGSVGLLSMRCFGAWLGPPSERFALSLARGLQLTNILRDVREDAGLGRLYLPAHVLDAAGLPRDLSAADHPRLPEARAMLGADARAAFAAADAEIGAHRRLPLLPALMMMGPYERLLARMEADWTCPPAPRGAWGKLSDAARLAARGGLAPRP